MSSTSSPVPVLYEDDAYIVFNKPAGLLAVPALKEDKNTLVQIVNKLGARPGDVLYPCHRLDRETSGVIVFAKSKGYQQQMMDLFRSRAVAKKYIAFVHGNLPAREGEFRKPIQNFYKKTRGKGQPAVTRYKVLMKAKGFNMVEVQPITGRTNQIRVHFSQAGFPLIGDRKFSFPRDYSLKFRRTALHASKIEWVHPVTKALVTVGSDLPKDMEDFLRQHQGSKV